jgi:hypothetical protein
MSALAVWNRQQLDKPRHVRVPRSAAFRMVKVSRLLRALMFRTLASPVWNRQQTYNSRRRRILESAAFWVGILLLAPAHFIFEFTQNIDARIGGLALFAVGIALIALKIFVNITLDIVESFRNK